MRAMVTGAHGFMGSNITRYLHDLGWDVKANVRPGGNFRYLEGLPVPRVEADLLDADGLAKAAEDVDVIFHLASCTHQWNRPDIYERINVQGTQNLVEGARKAGVKRIVYMSSLAVHHFSGIRDGHEDTPQDGWLFHGYAQSKQQTEKMLRERHDAGDLEVTIIRPGVVPYGPNDQTHVEVFDAMRKGGWAYVNGGRALVSTVYVDNLAHGMVLAAQADHAAGECYIIADDHKLTWREFSEAFIEALGGKPVRTNAPLWAVYPVGWAAEMAWKAAGIYSRPPLMTRYLVSLAGKDFYFLPRKAESDLDYRPIVSWEESVERTVKWYLDEHGK